MINLHNPPPTVTVDTFASSASIHFTIDGGGSTITTGAKNWLRVPFNMTIKGWEITADQTSDIVVDVWKDTYTNYPPTDADSIAGTELPTLVSINKNQDLDLTSWTTSVTKGDYLKFNVDSVTSAQAIYLTLTGQRTGE